MIVCSASFRVLFDEVPSFPCSAVFCFYVRIVFRVVPCFRVGPTLLAILCTTTKTESTQGTDDTSSSGFTLDATTIALISAGLAVILGVIGYLKYRSNKNKQENQFEGQSEEYDHTEYSEG